jgi:hypothetical protein
LSSGRIDDSGGDSFGNQSGRFADPIDGSFESDGNAKENRFDHLFAGVFQDISFNLYGQSITLKVRYRSGIVSLKAGNLNFFPILSTEMN